MQQLLTLPDPSEMYIARLGTDHSRSTARSALRTVAASLGVDAIDWSSLTYADLARVRASLSRLSVAWGNTVWSITRQVLLEGRRLGLIDDDVVDGALFLPRLRGTSGRLGRDIEDAEIEALLGCVDDDTVVARRDGALCSLLIYGALRRSECVSLHVADWCPTTRQLRVLQGKGRKERIVPMSPDAALLIDRWLEVHPGGDRMLRSVDRWQNIGGALSQASVPKVLSRLCAMAGVAPLSAHAFRARRLSQVISASDSFQAAALAGHSSISTTARYDRRGVRALAALVDSLDRPDAPPRLRSVA